MPTGTSLQVLALEGLTFGAVNSLHCIGMCGPLAAFFLHDRRASFAWQTGRAGAYVAVGALAGALGLALGAGRFATGGAWFAFALAAALVLVAFGFEKVLSRVPGLGGLVTKVTRRAQRLPLVTRALVLGATTPLLPCGLLYAACAAAIASGGPVQGAVSVLGFALGGLPLLLFTHWNLGHLTRRFGAARMRTIARAAMLLAAAVLAWRGVTDLSARDAGHAGGCCSETSSTEGG